MSKKWSIGARSETGYVRSENQDRMSYVKHQFGDVYIVSDGMGGHRGGALAAALTIEVLNQWLAKLDSVSAGPGAIKTAFEEANRAVYDRGHAGSPDTEGMGATAVVLVVAQDQVMIAHVGDSRAYLFTGKNKLKHLTKDHSRVQRMVDVGILSPAEASTHPDASILEQAIGVSPEISPDISPWMRVRKGDRILLCSDGLHGYVSDDEIAGILGNQGTPQDLVDRLIQLALEKGGEDNVTVQLITRETRNGLAIFRGLGRMTMAIPGILVLSSAAVFLITEYWPATLKIQLRVLEHESRERDTELLERADKLDEALESLRIQIAQLNQKMDRLGKAPPNSISSSRAGKTPKPKKNTDPSPAENSANPSSLPGKNTLLDSTDHNLALSALKTGIAALAIHARINWTGKSGTSAKAKLKPLNAHASEWRKRAMPATGKYKQGDHEWRVN